MKKKKRRAAKQKKRRKGNEDQKSCSTTVQRNDTANVITKRTVSQKKAHTARHEHSLHHREALLVKSTGNLEDISLETIQITDGSKNQLD